ncbi:MAG: hypothetical protein K6T91_05385 [Firmicutes bacterium]|nr:hypothetical protein [Bacillota bacterium]
MERIKRFFRKLDDEMAAYAFAEEGELQMAKQILAESGREVEEKKTDQIFKRKRDSVALIEVELDA